MAFFHRKKREPVFLTDSIDDNPALKYNDLGWQVVSDEQDYDQLHNEFKHNAIARRIVAKPAEDATRNGFRLVIPGNPTKQAIYQQALDNLKLTQVLSQHVMYRYLDGDSYLHIGLLEKPASDTSTPVNVANIKNVAFVHAFGQNHIDSYYTNDDPTSIDYGKESAIVLRPEHGNTEIDKNGNQVPDTPDLSPRVIDASRYFHISLDKFDDDETGTSILTRCKDQLRAMDIALETTGKMLREFTFKVVKSDALMSEGEDDFKRDKRELGQALNSEATMFLHNADSVEKVTTPTTGIDTLFGFAWQQLCTACGIPKSVLIGEQAGTLAGASQDVINYYDGIKSIQKEYLEPEIKRIVELLMWSQDVAGGAEDPDSFDWHIEFNPLWSEDNKTKSEEFLNYANGGSTLIGSGAFGPDQVANMFASQNNNGNGFMQTSDQVAGDSADITDADIAKYKKILEKVTHHGGKT